MPRRVAPQEEEEEEEEEEEPSDRMELAVQFLRTPIVASQPRAPKAAYLQRYASPCTMRVNCNR